MKMERALDAWIKSFRFHSLKRVENNNISISLQDNRQTDISTPSVICLLAK